MKKTLAIFLALIVVFSVFFCLPLIGSGEGVTAASFTDGVAWQLSEGGNITYLRTTNGWGSYTGANGSVTITDPNSCRSTMANIKGFTVGKTYDITFTATGISAVFAVLNYDSAYFNTDQIVKAKAGNEGDLVVGSVSGSTATITVAPTSDNIYLIVKNKAGTVTLNNFSVTESANDANNIETVISNINNGLTWGLSEGGNIDYLRLTNGWGSFVSADGAVTITDPNSCRSTMAYIKGFSAGETYELTFNATGISAVYAVLNYSSAYFNTDQIVMAKSGKESDLVAGTVSNDVATITFTPTSDDIYLIVKNKAGTVKLSNFAIATVTDEDSEDANIAKGDWYITKNAGGTVTKGDNSVSFTGTQYQTMYTKITGLTANTTYKLTFDVSPEFAAQVWMLAGNAELTFTIDGTVPGGAASIGSISGTSAVVEFTAENDSQYIFFRNCLSTSATSQFTFSNFELTVKAIGEPTGTEVAGGTWWSTRGATYYSFENNVSWTSDPSWHSVYTELKGLKPNTKYELYFEHNIVDSNQIELVWLYTGTKNSMTLNSAKDRPAEYTSCTVEKKTGAVSATFITGAEESVYCIGLKVGSAEGLVLSNIAFGKWIPKEVTAEAIASGQWTLGEGGRSTTDLVGTDGWGKFYGVNGTVTITDPNSCRTSFTKVTGFTPGKEYELTFIASGIEGAAAVLENGSAYINGQYQSLSVIEGKEENIVKATREESRYVVRFTAKNDYIYLTVKNNSGTVTLSDFIFDPIKVSASTKWGGKVSISPSTVVAKNTSVTFTATPSMRNYFVGWYMGETLVSGESTYSVIVENDISLTAVFGGTNTSSDDIFSQRGYDGTFENGTIGGWYATHYNAADANHVGFCNYTVSSRHAYEGNKSLRIQAYHRCSILPLTDLNKNTNYRLSFYVLYEDNGGEKEGYISANAILDSLSIHTVGANKVYSNVTLRNVKANTGWYKVDMYFNTGDATAVNYELYYGSEDYSTGCAYIDNMTLSEYTGNNSVLNADFSIISDNDGTDYPSDWMTDASAATDGSNGVLKLDNEQTAYQIINTDVDGLYTVSFRAKGEVRGAAVDLAKNSTNIKNLLSSVSYVDTDKNGWNRYTFRFYTNNQQAIKLMFEGLSDGAMVDDVKLTKSEVSAGGIVENIDFESERFALTDVSDESFEIYNKSSNNDTNVLSGNYSLKFSPSGVEDNDKFIESFMSYQPVKGISYTITFNYKATGSGEIYLSPDIKENYGVQQGYTYSLGKGWKKAEFHFTALDTTVLKAIMSSIVDSTIGDVYFDDISIKSRLPLIYEYDLENTYCDAIFNAIDYTGFEYFKENGNMGKLPKGFSVVKSASAQSGTSILTVKAGNKQIFAFNTKASKIYEFSVSLKGNNKTKGSVSVTVDANGKYYYSDTNGVTRSKVTAPTNGKWKREAFSFVTNTSGITYVVIECSGGTMEVDDMMLFESSYATPTDNNDYTIYKNYNYKNPTVKIYNGGYNEDGTIGDGGYGSDGSLGDYTNIKLVFVLLVASVLVLVLSVIIKKRKGEHCA